MCSSRRVDKGCSVAAGPRRRRDIKEMLKEHAWKGTASPDRPSTCIFETTLTHETFVRVRHPRLLTRPRCHGVVHMPARRPGVQGAAVRTANHGLRSGHVPCGPPPLGERCRVRRKFRTAAVQISRAASAPSAIATSTSLGDTLSPAMSTRTPSWRRASASPSHASGASHTTTRSIPAIADSRPV